MAPEQQDTTTRIRVLIVDDHPVLRHGLAALINGEADLLLVAGAETGQEALALFEQYRPDITLLDLRLPDLNGVEVLRRMRLSQELLRHANSRITLEVYTRAISATKREANDRVMQLVFEAEKKLVSAPSAAPSKHLATNIHMSSEAGEEGAR